MATINRKQGSATSPRPDGGKSVVIAHLCNNQGAWGAGFVLAVNDLSMAPKAAYQALCRESEGKEVALGTLQFVETSIPNLWVANMIAQTDVEHYNPPSMVDSMLKFISRL